MRQVSIYEKLQNCLKCVRSKTDFVPKVAIVLGSGLGDYAALIDVVCNQIRHSFRSGRPHHR